MEKEISIPYKIVKTLTKTRYMAERYPQDFCGASPQRIELLHLSSDEKEMDEFSLRSVLDLELSSEDEEIDDEILVTAQRVEKE